MFQFCHGRSSPGVLGGLSPQTLDHRQYFALILCKLHEIWLVDSQENHYNCCHQMSYFKAKMYHIQFLLGLRPSPRWGRLQRSPDSLAGFNGPTCKGREGRQDGMEGQERGDGSVGDLLLRRGEETVSPPNCAHEFCTVCITTVRFNSELLGISEPR